MLGSCPWSKRVQSLLKGEFCGMKFEGYRVNVLGASLGTSTLSYIQRKDGQKEGYLMTLLIGSLMKA